MSANKLLTGLVLGRWERALEMLGQEAECHKETGQYDNLFRVWLSMIVLNIKSGDIVSADQVWANNQEYVKDGALGWYHDNRFIDGILRWR